MNDDKIKELFKREIDRYEFLYAKANTKSKKKDIAYDLIFFEGMYNKLVDKYVSFPWSNDIDLLNLRIDVVNVFIRNIFNEQDLLKEIFENNFNIFLDEKFSLYTDYCKCYHKISEEILQKNIGMFLRNIDKSLVDRFKSKLLDDELFLNNNLALGNLGLTFPLELVNKNIIMLSAPYYFTIESASALVHELGHDFEFEHAKMSGDYSVWRKLSQTIYYEICPHFFEYAFINYLVDNKIYLEDSLMLKRRYLSQVFYYLSNALISLNIDELQINYSYMALLGKEDEVNYANELLMKMNSCSELYNVGDKINFKDSFIYSMGRLMSIYLYDIYKENPKEFLSNFKKILVDYKNNNFEAFEQLGVTKEMVSDGSVLRRVLREVKRDI